MVECNHDGVVLVARKSSPAYGWKSAGISLLFGFGWVTSQAKSDEDVVAVSLMLALMSWPFTYVGLRIYMWMQMEACPSCGEQVAKNRVMCPHCGGRGNR